jgi:hypothetical protein
MKDIIHNPELFMPLIVSFFGFILLLIGIYYYRKAKQTLNWYTTIGTIINSRVKTNQDSEHGTTYESEISYSFTVESQSYVSNKIIAFMNYGTSFRKSADNITNKYPVNTKVNIYYNPSKTKESVIEPGVKTANIIFMIIGFLIFIVPLIVVYFPYFINL